MHERVLNNRYRISNFIGSGGFTDVFLADDLRTDTLVAVKILHSWFSSNRAISIQFLQEADAARVLSEPRIAKILDVNEDNGTSYAVVEYVKGHTLAQSVKLHHQLTVHEAISYTRQVLQALEEAHAFGIVHQNLKPQNIMIADNSRVKVTDFGIAKHLAPRLKTQAGISLVSPQYLSPEQVNGAAVDPRTDLCALAITLYELLVGRPPFGGNTPKEVLAHYLNTQPPHISIFRLDVPIPLEAMIERGIEKEPAHRFQSAGEMLQALDEIARLYYRRGRTRGLFVEKSGCFAPRLGVSEDDQRLDSNGRDRSREGTHPAIRSLLVGMGMGLAAIVSMGVSALVNPSPTHSTADSASAIPTAPSISSDSILKVAEAITTPTPVSNDVTPTPTILPQPTETRFTSSSISQSDATTLPMATAASLDKSTAIPAIIRTPVGSPGADVAPRAPLSNASRPVPPMSATQPATPLPPSPAPKILPPTPRPATATPPPAIPPASNPTGSAKKTPEPDKQDKPEPGKQDKQDKPAPPVPKPRR